MSEADYRARAHAWYKSRRWQQLRKQQLTEHPFCQCQHHRGRRVRGNVVDHKRPHRGDIRLFFDRSNLQTMTKACHDSFKQSEERGGAGFLRGCDEHGVPLSHAHHWHSAS